MEELMASSFSWYEFRKGGKVILASGCPKAVTDMLVRRGLNVVTSGPADYIIDYCGMDCADPAARLQELLAQLSEGGTLLLAVTNRYGLKYFCGAGDPYGKRFGDGLNGYPDGTEGDLRGWSRPELDEMLKGLTYKYYYPLPDIRMPQMIYTEDYLEASPAKERLLDYDYSDRSMFHLEHRILPDAIDSGALPFLANTFIIEITKGGSLSDILFAVMTEDRGKTRGMVTSIRENGKVYKRPIYDEGIPHIRKLASYTDDLISKGVPVVPVTLAEDLYGTYLESERILSENLGSSMRREAAADVESLTRWFDLIYDYIFKAAGLAEGSRDGSTILPKGYIDLAPCNAFRDGDGLIFYDQEFMQENVPAGYIMYRTLKYFFQYAYEIKDEDYKAYLFERYGINDIESYEKMEQDFIGSVRSRDRYEELYRMSTPDREMMAKRREDIAEDGSKPYRIGYVPGVFDLLHEGHINLLRRCKERCRYLIVGVLTDDLVEYYKNKRPVMSLQERCAVLDAVKYVDETIPVDMSNTDKLDAWEQLHYDCHFSGDDHVGHWNDVLTELRKRGSNMEFFPYTQGISSTSIKEKMKGEGS